MPGKFSPRTQKLKWDEGTVTLQRTNTVHIYTPNTMAFHVNTTMLTIHFLLEMHILPCHKLASSMHYHNWQHLEFI